MHRSLRHSGTVSDTLRFSNALVPDGKVPSTGIALTGIASPLPANIFAVTSRTKTGASSGTSGGNALPSAVVGTGTCCIRASAPSTAALFICTTRSPWRP